MKSPERKIRIVLTGGGTGGSVTPLLAVAEDLLKRYAATVTIVWIGMNRGVERTMTAPYPFIYKTISAGKWRRYFSLKNIIDLFKLMIGFIQAFFILLSFRPHCIMSAGSFISVPVVWAAWLLRIRVIIHQQDIRPGLANKLMAPCASVITVSFEKSLADYGKKAIWTGNPIRSAFLSLTQKAEEATPVVLILGGGTGSETINRLVSESIGELVEFCKVIHITGKENVRASLAKEILAIENYERYDLLDTNLMARALRRATLVVTRAGLGILSELSYLGIPALIIPIPDSHQEDNADYFSEHGAAVVLDQRKLTARQFSNEIDTLLSNKEKLTVLGERMSKAMKHDANTAIMNIIEKYIN